MVPGGVVCFFPSYDYEKRVHSRWTETNALDKIGKKKKVKLCSLCSTCHGADQPTFLQVFREPKLTSQVDLVLSQYARCIEVRERGAMLW